MAGFRFFMSTLSIFKLLVWKSSLLVEPNLLMKLGLLLRSKFLHLVDVPNACFLGKFVPYIVYIGDTPLQGVFQLFFFTSFLFSLLFFLGLAF